MRTPTSISCLMVMREGTFTFKRSKAASVTWNIGGSWSPMELPRKLIACDLMLSSSVPDGLKKSVTEWIICTLLDFHP